MSFYRLKIETLKRCEDVLQKLHDKVEKVGFVQRRLLFLLNLFVPKVICFKEDDVPSYYAT
jgi:hypothetical protein